MITKEKINTIVEKIAIGFNPEKIILFGSHAVGNQSKDSDLDLLVIQDTNLPRHKRSFDIQKSLLGSMIPMDILVYTKNEFEQEKTQTHTFLYNAMKGSKILYERN
jgi:predicted nucleotidyltransferase